MSAVSLLQRLAGIESLSHIPLTMFLTLIHRASALKRDISLPQTLGTSIDCAPPSVALFLAESVQLSEELIHEFWGVFKDEIWKNSTVDERERIGSEALQLHGHNWVYYLPRQLFLYEYALPTHVSSATFEEEGLATVSAGRSECPPDCPPDFFSPDFSTSLLSRKYALVFWMSGSSIEKLHQGFSKILDLIDHRDRHMSSQSAVLAAAQRWLEESDSHETSWLIVVDNANQKTVHFLRQHLPRKNSMGAILFTTRTHAVASALVQAEQQLLLELTPPELTIAIEIFLKEANSGIPADSFDYQVIQEVVKSFGCLPLAISHAASISKQLHLRAKEFLELCMGPNRFEVSGLKQISTVFVYSAKC
ncbi:hypothetical protein FIBSPDRAFT_1053192 [Athelia psychrophila]|uniref:NB-ARC domain-containing protein n=1 Tax=Athelia psychrophila TaxID=1759441 RepID=A0A167XCH7_9AGAM|nr:hypothetical protein FIBSPDRAFT_1053192 [Fibularhizoctonia sp. CBS 109695]